ncbi:MAG: 16S rRNA (uracil(1498)-N(3))-methyltransferase [Puniceicoccales bacterium]|nr:16S rRNA (uracil(1498)-N(3))-methyltransferase [Puniceicoccales bacterium]
MAIFFVPSGGPLAAGRPHRIAPNEAHHLLHVLRAGAGDRIVLFDGRGTTATCSIVGVDPCILVPGPVIVHSPQKPALHLLVGLGKQQAMDLLLRQATELGVATIHPIMGDFCTVLWREERCAGRRRRWEAIILEAAKQAKNPFLPVLHGPKSLDQILAKFPPNASGVVASLQTAAISWRTLRTAWDTDGMPDELWLAVGPEGDFSPSENGQLLGKGFTPLSLGPRVLTMETAALALLAACQLDLAGVAIEAGTCGGRMDTAVSC